ncbi:PKD domain-containing protein [Streptacidiphilus cavernicola]|uniref:PKD domain-containing protein n=1 Tax=Streptacidiphilus cavernicola TaxID=3342716 RepID=A0ABV6VXV8_9ACTN
MRLRRPVALLGSILLSGSLFQLALPVGSAAADGAAGSTIYVGTTAGDVCSDTAAGRGSQQTPYCTPQSAVDAAQPGQTVQIASGQYKGELDVTHSGEPGAPITITHGDNWGLRSGAAWINYEGAQGIVLTGVHDVVVRGLSMLTTGDAVQLTDSSDVTVENTWMQHTSPAAGNAATGIAVGGGSSAVTLAHDWVTGYGNAGVAVGGAATDGAATGTTVTGSVLLGNGAGIVATDAPGARVVGNTLATNCGSALVLGGGSSGALIENNIASRDGVSSSAAVAGSGCLPATAAGAPELNVSADSAPGSSLDYNLVFPQAGSPAYRWNGVDYPTAAALTVGTTEGTHDLNSDPQLTAGTVGTAGTPAATSPAVDSADANAPGETPLALNNLPRVDVPGTPNTGTGSGYVDRGAIEVQDPFAITSVTPSEVQGPAPLAVTLTAAVSNPWGSPVSYHYDFGDGSQPVDSSSASVDHTYATARPFSSYEVTVTANLPFGAVRTAYTSVAVEQPGPLTPSMLLGDDQVDRPLSVYANLEATTSPWPVSDVRLDYGDGTGAHDLGTALYGTYDYQKPGTYLVTATITDRGGRTAQVSQLVTAGNQYVPLHPARVLDTRSGTGAPKAAVGPGGVVRLKVAGAGGIPAHGAAAVTLNVTETGATRSSYLSAYPGGTSRPTVSNLNFGVGQTTQNQVTVPIGADGTVSLYNASGQVQVIADVQGYYTSVNDGSVPQGSYFEATGPTRVLDTRQGGSGHVKVGPGQGTVVHVGLDSYTRAALLHVTATGATAGTYITAYATGTARPDTSILNVGAGQTVSNLVSAPVDADGDVTLYNHSGSVDLIVDLAGWYSTVAVPSSSYIPLAPTRVLDTVDGTGAAKAKVGPGATLRLKVAGLHGVPANATAVLVNLTGTGPTAATYVTAYADGGTRPTSSSLNLTPGATVPNLALVPIGADGDIALYNHSGSVDLIADVQGYFG